MLSRTYTCLSVSHHSPLKGHYWHSPFLRPTLRIQDVRRHSTSPQRVERRRQLPTATLAAKCTRHRRTSHRATGPRSRQVACALVGWSRAGFSALHHLASSHLLGHEIRSHRGPKTRPPPADRDAKLSLTDADGNWHGVTVLEGTERERGTYGEEERRS